MPPRVARPCKPETRIKSYIEEAIRNILQTNPGWKPSEEGGEWRFEEEGIIVTFNPPTRFQTKGSAIVFDPTTGRWVANLNGLVCLNVGKPALQEAIDKIRYQEQINRLLGEEQTRLAIYARLSAGEEYSDILREYGVEMPPEYETSPNSSNSSDDTLPEKS